MAGTRKYVAGFTRGSFLTASRGRNPDSTPPTPLRLGLSKPAPRETDVVWAGPGAEALSSPGPGLSPPPSSQDGKQRKGEEVFTLHAAGREAQLE